jgi:hypothetical protein
LEPLATDQLVLSELGNVAIPFDAQGEALEHALVKSLRLRNEAIKSLCSSVRRFRDTTVKPECKSDYPHALQALWEALDRAEDLIQN